MSAYNLTSRLKNVLKDMVGASRNVASDEFRSRAMAYGMEFGIIFEAGGIQHEVPCEPVDVFQLRDENLIAYSVCQTMGLQERLSKAGLQLSMTVSRPQAKG